MRTDVYGCDLVRVQSQQSWKGTFEDPVQRYRIICIASLGLCLGSAEVCLPEICIDSSHDIGDLDGVDHNYPIWICVIVTP